MKDFSSILSHSSRILAVSALVMGGLGLTVDTAEAGRGGNGMKMMQRLDTDESGTVSRAEFLAGTTTKTERRFDRRDENGDGSITEDEYPAARVVSAEREAFRQCLTDALGTPVGRPAWEEFLANADLDLSGSVDLGEFSSLAEAKSSARFDELDIDDDGEITDVELSMAKEARKAQRQARREAKAACRELLNG